MPTGKAAGQHAPVPARGREVWASARESDQPIRPGRCPARMRRIDRHGLPAKVLENPLNDRRRFDAGNDTQPAAALPAGLDVYDEYALEALGPGHPPLPTGDRCCGTFGDGGSAGRQVIYDWFSRRPVMPAPALLQSTPTPRLRMSFWPCSQCLAKRSLM